MPINLKGRSILTLEELSPADVDRVAKAFNKGA